MLGAVAALLAGVIHVAAIPVVTDPKPVFGTNGIKGVR